MANPNNRFLNEKDRKKAANDIRNVYSQKIDEIMRGNMAAGWQPSSDNDIKRNNGLPSAPTRQTSSEAKKYISDLKAKDEEKRFSEQRAAEKKAAKRSNNPYVRRGKQTQEDADKRQAEGKKKFSAAKEKYPIVKQMDTLFNNTARPAAEGLLKAAGDTVGEVATIGNKEGKKNLRNYLSEREKAQKGVGKVVYKGSEIGTNLALMSTISNKIPGINKLDTLTKSKIANRALREGVENVIIGAGTDIAKGETDDFAKNRLKDMAGGAAFGAGLEVLGKVGKKVFSKSQNIPYKSAEEVINSKALDNESKKLDIFSEPEPLKKQPITSTIPQAPRNKYEISNPNGKMKPHMEGGYKSNDADIHIKDREYSNVGNKKVHAMSYEHPEMRRYVEAEAHALKGEVERSIKGGSGQLRDKNNTIIGGTKNKRIVSEDVKLMRNSGMSYKDINKGIDDIIAGHGKENSAAAKRVELVIDDRLSNGYMDDIYGESIPPVPEYISTKNQVYGEAENYSKIPKLAEREKIFQRFNEEYGNFPSKQATTLSKVDTQVNTPYEVKTSQNLNGDVLEGVNKTVDNVKNIPTNLNSETAYTELGDTAVSKMKTNTYTNAEFMQDEQAKKVVDRISGEYEVLHDETLIKGAKMELEENFDNVVKRLVNVSNGNANGLMDAKDITQAGLITNKLIQDSKVSGDTEPLKQWLKKVRVQATSLGQAVHAISTWKKQSPEGMLLKAQRTVDDVVNSMKTENPKKFSAAKEMADDAKSVLDDIVKKIKETEPNKPIGEILEKPSKKINEIVDAATKGKNTKVKEAVKDAVNNKEFDVTKMAEKILEKNGVPSLTDNDIKFITDKMEKIETMTDGREKDIEFALVKKLIAEKIPPTTKDKILAIQRTNLLLNTRTNIRNIAGNVIMSGLENAKDVIATPIDKAISKFTGQRTTTIPNISEQLKGFVKGAKEGLEDARLDIDTSRAAGRYSDLEKNAMKDLPQLQAFRKIDKPKTVIEHLNNLASKSEKATNTLLGLGDRPFFEAAFSGSIAQQLKLSGGEVTGEMVEKAVKEAEERTFQNVNELTKGMQKLKNGLNGIGKSFTGTDFNIGDIALPFIKTPANILDKAKDYSPIGGVQGLTKIIKGIKTGNLDQKKAIDQLSRGLTGSALIFAGYEMARNGVIYGKGAKDADAKALEKQAGRLPYSIKNGDKYTTIDWIQPAAIPLMIGADIFEQKKSQKDADNIVINAIMSGGKTLFDQSLLSGMTNLFGGYGSSGGEKLLEGVKDTAIGGVNQFVPFGSALNQITKLTDKNVRNTYAESDFERQANIAKAKLPWTSKSLPKKYSTVGNEIKQNYGAEGLENAFHTLINPATTGKYNPTEAEKLALDIYDRSGETMQIPRLAKKKINYKTDDGTKNGKKEVYSLTAKEQSELQRIMGKKTEEAFSSKAKEAKFQNLSDAEKAKELQKLMTELETEAKFEILDKKKINYKK